MLVRGVRLAKQPVAFERIASARELTGQSDTDNQSLAALRSYLVESNSRLVVHYAIEHDQELTGKHEHVGLICPTGDGQNLLLINLKRKREVREMSKFKQPEENTELQDAMRQTLVSLPVIRDVSEPDFTDTRFGHALHGLVTAKREKGEYEFPPYVDLDGGLKAAIARLAIAQQALNKKSEPVTASASNDVNK
jgi:hypothetical protein